MLSGELWRCNHAIIHGVEYVAAKAGGDQLSAESPLFVWL